MTNINDLKTKCNALYGRAIELMEQSGDRSEICRGLLAAAEMLVEIGKLSPADKPRAEANALKLLNASKALRAGESPSSVYQTLTGKALPEQKEEIVHIELPDVKESSAAPDCAAEKPVVKAYEKNEKSDTDGNSAIKDILKRDIKSDPVPTPSDFTFNWDSLPHVTFDDVAGLEDVKDAVRKKVLLPLIKPELYEGYDKKNGGGVLLYGPPGTGKTMIAAAIAREIGAKFCSIGASDILTNGIGSSEKIIKTLFSEARSFPCAVIFFDEIESICPVSTHAQHAREIRSELLRQIQGLDAYGKQNDKILFLIAATNKPWDIDPAFVRPGRFGTRIYVGLPDKEARKYMIESRIVKIRDNGKVSVESIDYDDILKKTEGFNGADVTNLLDEVQEISIMRAAKTNEKVLYQSDFDKALEKVTSSAQQKDIDRLESWRKENG